jgi:HEAT repeat protein
MVTRRVALSILGKQAPTLGLPAILDYMSDVDRNIRMDAYKLVGEIGDQRAIDLLVDRISTSDREQVTSVLAKFGSIVQPKVLPLLSHQNESVRQHVCRLIGRIGTPEAIEPLKQLAANETSLRVRLQASAAIQSIMDNRSTDNQ